MKTVILAGGLGTRLAEETDLKPKPMVEIGGKPILWHIMNIYAAHGFNEFIIALGYKAEVIKDYFVHFYERNNDLTIDLSCGSITVHHRLWSDWRIHLVDTGLHTQIGGRIKRLRDWVEDSTFMLTYGDGLANIDIRALVDYHKNHGQLATVTAVHPPARFGELKLSDDAGHVSIFNEKPQTNLDWINGGFFVLDPKIMDYIDGDNTIWERGPLEKLAKEQHLRAFKHKGYWQPIDTLREMRVAEKLWASGKAPWKVWE